MDNVACKKRRNIISPDIVDKFPYFSTNWQRFVSSTEKPKTLELYNCVAFAVFEKVKRNIF